MAIVDLAADRTPVVNGERRNNAEKRKGGSKGGFSFFFRWIAIGSVVSQVVFVSLVGLGRAKLELSTNGAGHALGAKQSLSSFVQDSGGESSDEEDVWDWDGDEVWPKPYGWENYHYKLIRKHFACKDYARSQGKPLNTLEDWHVFQSVYKEQVDPNAVFDDPVPPTMGKTFGDGGPPPYYAAHSTDGRGRGLFASRDIKEGELVEDCCGAGDVVFPDAASFRRFLFNLPRNRACDQIDWAWTQKLEDGGEYHILSSIHIAILYNSGKGSEINVAPPNNTARKFYATRDIKKDEQLLYDYHIYKTRWSEVGMGDVVREASASDAPQLGLDAAEQGGHRREPVWPKPSNWEEYDIKEIGVHFHCEMYAQDKLKPLPTLEDWRLLRTRYAELVDGSRPFDDPVPPTRGYTLGDGPPPFYAGTSPSGRGRGLFAARDIREGELTHDGAKGDVAFPDAAAYRRFVFSLPRNRACDVLDWTWTQRVGEGGGYWILSGMDISVLHNEGRGEEINVRPKSPTSLRFYATRDIKKDEELLTDYDIYDTVWKKVGLA